ncbi:MAG: hypothetical protein V7K26_27800 [Nostoc sp.]|uniref:hypothetical protein n=1 Tax=Nostoc sp. TaxID=1180 RepID=UPI002FEF7552
MYIFPLCDGVPARRRRSLIGKIDLSFGIWLHHGKYKKVFLFYPSPFPLTEV